MEALNNPRLTRCKNNNQPQLRQALTNVMKLKSYTPIHKKHM